MTSGPWWQSRVGRAIRWSIALALAAGIVFFARSLNFHALGRTLLAAALVPLVIASALPFVNEAVRGGFWKVCLAPIARVPFLALARYTIASTVVSIVVPAHAGAALRIALLKQRHAVAIPSSLGVAALEKVGDLTSFVLLMAPLPWLVPLSSTTRRALIGLALLLVIVGSAVVLLRRSPRSRASKWLSALAMFERPKLVAVALVTILIAWCVDLVEIALVMSAVGLTPRLGSALLVLFIVNLAIAVPLMPANAGTHELGSTLALSMLGVHPERAAAFALLYHASQTIPLLLLGALDARALTAAAFKPAQAEPASFA